MKFISEKETLPHWLRLALNAGTIMVSLFCVQIAPAQVSHTENVEGVEITFSLDKTAIAVGEPVTLKITLENVSGSPMINLATNFQLPEGNKLEVMVQPVGELPYRYTGPLEMGTYADTPLVLIKQVPLSVDTLLLYDKTQPTGYLFSQPGNYYIAVNFQFRLRNSMGASSAAMPAAQITVQQKDGAAREVYERLNKPELARMLHLSAATTDSLAVIEEAAERYPATPLGALAMRAAGRFYTHSTDADDRTKGAQLLQNFLANGIVPSDADNTAWDIAAAWHLNKEYDVAREWIFYLVRNYPDSVRIRQEDALVYYYFYAPALFAAQVPWYLLKTPWIIPGAEPPSSLSPRKVD